VILSILSVVKCRCREDKASIPDWTGHKPDDSQERSMNSESAMKEDVRRPVFGTTLFLLASVALGGCASGPHHLSYPTESAPFSYKAEGVASWYGPGFHGRKTASGERFNQRHLTCAHRTLPFGTKVKVTNLNNGEALVVTVNDRGPFVRNRLIDLSREAAQRLGIIATGTARVRVETAASSEEEALTDPD
jgi:rare lipoprotein A